MKKILIYLLSMSMLFSVCACGDSDSDSESTSEKVTNSTSKSKKINCPSCGEKQESGAAFCQDCGAEMSDKIKCYYCGEEISSDASFCQSCGESLSGSEEQYGETAEPYPENPEEGSDTSNEDEQGSAACLTCAYEGLDECEGHECLACNGKGYTECYNNCGDGCSFCDGGYVACFGCENGVVYYGDEPTDVTFGGESEPCTNCENGYIKCSMCDGTGKFGTYTVGGFDGADGTEVDSTCPKCGGRKKFECSYCNGYGTIVTY